ncbi:MAG: alkaline phosphatase family protein [Bacteroidetes bacterium]|nr:alkaline phosphatase family protein [Bacteroidota bacterium]
MKAFIPFILIVWSFNLYAQDTLKIAFGSCNHQNDPQFFFDSISLKKPDYWFWLGDNIYADTKDMSKMKKDYDKVSNSVSYQTFTSKIIIDGTWDDHDYGENDGGIEYPKKQESKALFADFIKPDSASGFYDHPGVYHSRNILFGEFKIKTIFLDTRSFRSPLRDGKNSGMRYLPSDSGSMLNEAQWIWLEKELKDTTVDFFIIASSIQVISAEHGYEKWENFPHERSRLLKLLSGKDAIILSGDRHIAEMSMLPYGEKQLFDITSSGLTHTWNKFSYEPNSNRVGRQFVAKNFGMLILTRENNGISVKIELWDWEHSRLLETVTVFYPQ